MKNIFEKYFSQFEFYQRNNCGLSVFNFAPSCLNALLGYFNNSHQTFLSIISSKISGYDFNKLKKQNPGFIFLFLDNLTLFKKNLQIINDMLSSETFLSVPIIFVTNYSEADLEIKVVGEQIHKNLNSVISDLLFESFIFRVRFENLIATSNGEADYIPKKTLIAKFKEHGMELLSESEFDFEINLNGKAQCVYISRDSIVSNQSDSIIFSISQILSITDNFLEALNEKLNPKKYNLSIEQNLDERQKIALNHISGPIRTLAPAGSGKTKTLVNRIANLVNTGSNPGRILALAFNKKAAIEMRERLTQIGLPVSKSIFTNSAAITTFHGFGYEIIRHQLKWSYNHEETRTKLRYLLKKSIENIAQLNYKSHNDPLDKYLLYLTKSKTELIDIERLEIIENNASIKFKPIFDKFVDMQISEKFFNFDDMVYLSARILLKNASLRKFIQNKFDFILIDEFQDLNRSQMLLMYILAPPHNNLFVVGDDDQMIYGWRGAEVKNILEFTDKFPSSVDCVLQKNYRSSLNIITHSKWLIDNNKNRVKKNITPREDAEEGIFEVSLNSSLIKQSIDAISWIEKIKKEFGYNNRDFAILYRYNVYQYLLAHQLNKHGFTCIRPNIQKLFEMDIAKDIVSYFKLIFCPDVAAVDELKRVLKRPNKYIRYSQIDKVCLWRDIENGGIISFEESWQKDKFNEFVFSVKKMQKLSSAYVNKPSVACKLIAKEFGLEEFYEKRTSASREADEAPESIIYEVFISLLEEFENIYEIIEFSKNINLYDKYSSRKISDENKIILSTIHSTKGNEYKNVVYFNMSKLKNESGDEEEEERRVAYVGITRAVKNILITGPKNNYSRFLRECALNPEFNNFKNSKLEYALEKSILKINQIEKKTQKLKKKRFGNSEPNKLIDDLESRKSLLLSNIRNMEKEIRFRKLLNI